MRTSLKRFLPDHDAVRTSRWLRPFANTLLHPRLWHLNRHSTAGAVAMGLFCGLIPGPFQMLSAAMGCVIFRVNLPLALVTTWYSNPLTIVPLYLLAYMLGAVLLGENPSGFAQPPAMGEMPLREWAESLVPWMLALGKPLAVGLVILGMLLALTGYFGVRWLYRIHLVRTWRRRSIRRALRNM